MICLKIALVDDEKIYKDEMSVICREFAAENQFNIEIAEYCDGESFLNSKADYSIVFMDIYMNGMDGILTAQKLRERGNNCLLIFMTSSGDHMPRLNIKPCKWQ